jgi:hypothetical protein
VPFEAAEPQKDTELEAAADPLVSQAYVYFVRPAFATELTNP